MLLKQFGGELNSTTLIIIIIVIVILCIISIIVGVLIYYYTKDDKTDTSSNTPPRTNGGTNGGTNNDVSDNDASDNSVDPFDPNQQNIKLFNLSKCLAISNTTDDTSRNIILSNCNDSNDKLWTLDSSNRLKNKNNKCITKSNNNNLIQDTCSNTNDQKWDYNSTNKTLKIRSDTNKCLGTTNNATTNGTIIKLNTCSNTEQTQKWVVNDP